VPHYLDGEHDHGDLVEVEWRTVLRHQQKYEQGAATSAGDAPEQNENPEAEPSVAKKQVQ
jgi:hypothetical protein